MIRRLYHILCLIPRLGLLNILYVAWYRFTIKIGLRKLLFRPQKFESTELLFNEEYPRHSPVLELSWYEDLKEKVSRLKQQQFLFFSRSYFALPVDHRWFFNPYTKQYLNCDDKHWTEIGDFTEQVGDIKCIWELSRFSWVTDLTRGAAAFADLESIKLLNELLNDWTEKNPVNIGPNWKSGQEAALRVFNLLTASFILNQDLCPSNGLIEIIEQHCQRIAGDVCYALAQDNNHGTSEAAALFIGGAWLVRSSRGDTKKVYKAEQWRNRGQDLLEFLVRRLILDDGSFSQRSTNYHRVLLDTLSLCEWWRRRLGLPRFSPVFYAKAEAAVNWLYQLVDSQSGETVNFGANDGSLFISLSSCDYRDYRPSLQLASLLFFGAPYFSEGPWNEVVHWLKVDLLLKESSNRGVTASPSTSQFALGGYLTIHSKRSWAFVHAPQYRFRPSHADALHLDLWYCGQNVICDSGTYSYNCTADLMHYFSGTSAHNCITFDDRDQLPRIGRFLFGDWRSVESGEIIGNGDNSTSWEGKYRDSWGVSHCRRIEVTNDCWVIRDLVRGNWRKATLRWHLIEREWNLENNSCFCPELGVKISYSINNGEAVAELGTAPRSQYYHQMFDAPVLEIIFSSVECWVEVVTTIKCG